MQLTRIFVLDVLVRHYYMRDVAYPDRVRYLLGFMFGLLHDAVIERNDNDSHSEIHPLQCLSPCYILKKRLPAPSLQALRVEIAILGASVRGHADL